MKKRNFVQVLITAFLALVVIGGYHIYRINSFKSKIKPIAAKDNVLTEEMLKLSETARNMTWAEHAEKLNDNRKEREQLIRQVKLLEPYVYKSQVDTYAKLMELENEYVRAEALQLPAIFERTTKQEARQKAPIKLIDEYVEEYGYTDAVKADSPLSKRLQELQDELAQSTIEVDQKMKGNLTTLTDWSKVEQQYYPSFLPSRNFSPLIKDKMDKTEKRRKAMVANTKLWHDDMEKVQAQMKKGL